MCEVGTTPKIFFFRYLHLPRNEFWDVMFSQDNVCAVHLTKLLAVISIFIKSKLLNCIGFI